MEIPVPHVLLALTAFIATLRLTESCRDSPPCTRVSDESLRQAMQRRDRDAVCRLLPDRMQCLQNALEACQKQGDLEERGDKNTIKSLPVELEQMKLKYKEICPGHTYNWGHSESGLASQQRNDGNEAARPVSKVVFVSYTVMLLLRHALL